MAFVVRCDFCGGDAGNPYFLVAGQHACSSCRQAHLRAEERRVTLCGLPVRLDPTMPCDAIDVEHPSGKRERVWPARPDEQAG